MNQPLHFQDNTIPIEDRAAKLRPLMDNLKRKLMKNGEFPEYLAIDESMIPYLENILLNNLFGESLSDLDTKCGPCVQTEDIYIHLNSIWVNKKTK